jgi:hypothetical protein
MAWSDFTSMADCAPPLPPPEQVCKLRAAVITARDAVWRGVIARSMQAGFGKSLVGAGLPG